MAVFDATIFDSTVFETDAAEEEAEAVEHPYAGGRMIYRITPERWG
jgi:hypothetical protein